MPVLIELQQKLRVSPATIPGAYEAALAVFRSLHPSTPRLEGRAE
jgi:hypothetical protein